MGAFITRFAAPLGPDVAQRFAWCSEVTDAQASGARAFRDALPRARWTDLLGDDGVLLLPTMPDIAPLSLTRPARRWRTTAIARSGCCAAPAWRAPAATVAAACAQRDGAPLGISLSRPVGTRSLADQLRPV
jgi:amidase